MENNKTQVEKSTDLQIDLLKRTPFVERVFNVANTFHKQKKTACYAINGPWGSGKTYVLGLIEKRLKEPGKERGEYEFLVLRYNCWEYDYYDEPLLSIVATLLDATDKFLLDEDTKASLKSALKTVGNLLLNGFISYMDTKTGGAASKIADAVDSFEDTRKALISQAEVFNDKLPFQKALKLLREKIKELSSEYTVVFLVDELDRCLPEYAIRVLERLHHLLEGLSNVQLIFSVDTIQLQHVVKQLYGEKADAVSYLKKFISFELNLDLGVLNSEYDKDFDPNIHGTFDRRFSSYVNLFNQSDLNEEKAVAQFKAHILDGFDIRKRIALVEKAELLHRLTWPSSEIGSANDLCVELFLTAYYEAMCTLANEKNMSKTQMIDSWKEEANAAFHQINVALPNLPCFNFLKLIYHKNQIGESKIFWPGPGNRFYYKRQCLYGVILFVYRRILDIYQSPTAEAPISIRYKDFWTLLEAME